MHTWIRPTVGFGLLLTGFTLGTLTSALDGREQQPQPAPPKDAVADAQTPRGAPAARPEQKKSEHDRSDAFKAAKAKPITPALDKQPQDGKVTGFDFFRDPLDAKKPMQTFEETMKADVEAKPKVMALQRQLLEGRYDLRPKHDPRVTMSRGKPLCVGPTARLADGLTWDKLAALSPEEVKKRG